MPKLLLCSVSGWFIKANIMTEYNLEKVSTKKDFIADGNLLIIEGTELRIHYNKDGLDVEHDVRNTVDIWRVSDGLYLGKMKSEKEPKYFLPIA